MNDPNRIGRLAIVLTTWPFDAAATIAEYVMSQRGMACCVLAMEMILSTSGWLRPPLSPDIRGHAVSLGLFASPISDAELLEGRGRITFDSPLVVMTIIAAPSVAFVLVRPHLFAHVAGFLLSAVIAMNAAVALNHPVLLELLDRENSQRQAMVALLTETYPTVLSEPGNGRVSAAMTGAGVNLIVHGFAYLSFSKWLVVLGIVSTLYSTTGTIARRLRVLGSWVVVGVVLASVIVGPRLRGEYHVSHAKEAEMRGDMEEARHQLRLALTAFPALSNLVSTRLLQGALDYQQGLATTDADLWQAERWATNDDLPRALALTSGFLNFEGDAENFARIQAAKYLVAIGLKHKTAGRIASAAEFWRRARSLDPLRRDCVLYLGVSQSQMDLAHPDQVKSELEPALKRMADGAMRADIMNLVGDAYFLAGNATEARNYYKKSYELFNLPKTINYWALKGLGGF